MVATLSRDEWLELRRLTVGSSEAAAACGESRYKSAIRLAAEKWGGVPPDYPTNLRAIRRGHAMEAFVLSEYEEETGCKLLPTDTPADREAFEARITARGACEVVGWVEHAGRFQCFLRSRRWPWMTATLDGAAELPDGTLEVVEAKSLGWRQIMQWGDEDSGLAPIDYRMQVLHALAVTDAASACLVAMIGGDTLRLVRETAHAPTVGLQAIAEVERRFVECVRTQTDPDWDETSHEDARRVRHLLHPKDSGETVTLPEGVLELHEQRQATIAERLTHDRASRALKADEVALSSRIEALLGGATFGTLPDGSGEYEWRTCSRKPVAASSWKELTFKARKNQ